MDPTGEYALPFIWPFSPTFGGGLFNSSYRDRADGFTDTVYRGYLSLKDKITSTSVEKDTKFTIDNISVFANGQKPKYDKKKFSQRAKNDKYNFNNNKNNDNNNLKPLLSQSKRQKINNKIEAGIQWEVFLKTVPAQLLKLVGEIFNLPVE